MSLLVRKGKVVFLLIFLFAVTTGWAQQEELSLEQCQKEVQENFPLMRGKVLLNKSSELNVENLQVSYLPRLYANGQVSYQSDVTGISLPGVDIPKAPKDRYALNLDIEQLIYDGGKTRSRIEVEKKNTELEINDLEIQMYQLRARVNAAFYGIQLVRKSKLVLADKQKTISNRIEQIKSAVENGVVLPANLKVLQSEILVIDQQVLELNSMEESSFSVLSELMGRRIEPDVKLEETKFKEEPISSTSIDFRQRPEYLLYTNQKSLLEAQKELLKKDRSPVITGFGQAGYGNPTYNQLKDEFDTYYMIGAKISWNIFDWKSNRRKQKQIGFKKDLVETKELSFTQNQLIELGNETSKIRKFTVLLEKDDAIIELQTAVSESSASQLDNGVITSSDYLEDLNKEIQAKLNKEYHTIQLQQSIAEYNRVKGI